MHNPGPNAVAGMRLRSVRSGVNDNMIKTIRNSFASLVALGLLLLTGAAFAQDEPSGRVVWATAQSVDEVELQIEAFNAHYPKVRVETLFMGVGEIASRIQAEAANPQIDVWTSGGVGYRESMDQDLLRSYVSTEDAAFPDDAKDTENHKWYGQYSPPQIIFVNTNLLSVEDSPTSWADLGDPKFKGMILMANPALSSSAFAQVNNMVHLGGWELVEAVLQNATVTPSSRLAWQGVADGEYAIGMVTENTALTLAHEGYPVRPVYPSEGVDTNLNVGTLVANSPNPDNAALLFDWLNSQEAHELVAQPPHFERSARPDVTLHDSMLSNAEIVFGLTREEATPSPEAREELLEKFDELLSNL